MKYNTTQIILDKVNAQGIYENKKTIKCLDILTLDNGVKIAFGYLPKARKPFSIVAVYQGISTIVANGTSQIFMNKVSTITSDMVINQYKKLKLIK